MESAELNQDNSVNDKNYTTEAQYNVGEVVGKFGNGATGDNNNVNSVEVNYNVQ